MARGCLSANKQTHIRVSDEENSNLCKFIARAISNQYQINGYQNNRYSGFYFLKQEIIKSYKNSSRLGVHFNGVEEGIKLNGNDLSRNLVTKKNNQQQKHKVCVCKIKNIF